MEKNSMTELSRVLQEFTLWEQELESRVAKIAKQFLLESPIALAKGSPKKESTFRDWPLAALQNLRMALWPSKWKG